MQMATVTLFIVLFLLIGGILLQIFLSRRESKWLGLILPAITFLYSLFILLGLALFDGISGFDIFILIASTFLIGNIPTIILLGIYIGCREKKKVRTQLDKMNIQDLD